MARYTQPDEAADPAAEQGKDPKIGNIPRRWKKLSGSTSWNNMLDPLDDDLRRYIIHYGERAMASYDAFNYDVYSKNCGSCRYPPDKLFDCVGLVLGNPFRYEITKYIYATTALPFSSPLLSESMSHDALFKQVNWIGYVAVTTEEGTDALGRRDILVAWRGTARFPSDAIKDGIFLLVPPGDDLFPGCPGILVSQGFKSLYVDSDRDSEHAKTSAREQVLSEVKRLVDKHRHEETSITVTGHSLGAALGTLNAIDIVHTKANKVGSDDDGDDGNGRRVPVTAFLFATPHSGNIFLKELADMLPTLKILRIRNIRDTVPLVPLVIVGYVGIGEELLMDSLTSEYLNNPGDPLMWHELEVYLHLVAGTRGLFNRFRFGKVKRDLALINKYTAALRIRYLVPPFWRVTKNKFMVQQSDGSWKLDDEPRYLTLHNANADAYKPSTP